MSKDIFIILCGDNKTSKTLAIDYKKLGLIRSLYNNLLLNYFRSSIKYNTI